MSTMYPSRRGRAKPCQTCDGNIFKTDHKSGELYCHSCGAVQYVEQLPGIERDSEGNTRARTADKTLGSLVDKDSHPLQRKFQRFDGLQRYTGFETEMRHIIDSIFPPGTKKSKLSDLGTIMKIKRDYTEQWKKDTSSTKIPFFPTGGRSTGNHMPCLALTIHWPKLIQSPRSSVKSSIKEVEGILSEVEELPPQLKIKFDQKTVKFVISDNKELRHAWRFLLSKEGYSYLPPYPSPPTTPLDIREAIVKSHQSLFKQQSGDLTRRLYSVDKEAFYEIHVHPTEKYFTSLAFELERLIRGCPRAELNKSLSKAMRPSPEVSRKAEEIFSIVENRK